jgi:metacaspase-1
MSFLNTNQSKAALVVGINYTGHSSGELRGCINDTHKIVNFLKTRCGYTDENITILTDDSDNKPTKQNILNGINNLASKSSECKELWFSYSGHGAYLTSNNNDNESDNKDEVLVPLDYQTNGLIRDDTIYANLVKKIPTDCKLFSLIDACHSGTSLDLPYVYRVDSGIIENRPEENICNVLKISGCRDSQTSADAYINGKFQGALTFAFIKTMEDFNYNFTCKQIISRLKNYLNNNNYPQIPTLSLSKSSLLNELVMGDKNSEEPNVNICLKGDSWCKDESSWNLYSLNENKNVFDTNRRFYIKNEEINFKLHLENGSYILIFHDSYGDGGITGNIKYINNSSLIKDLNFNSGSYKSIEFNIDENNEPEVINKEEKEIIISIKGDYYVKYESSFNILDRLGSTIFNNDIKFESSNETKIVTCKLNKGKYKLKCIDTYGDGGMEGTIKQDNEILLSFNWNNLDWKENNGSLKYFDFELL